MGPTIGLMIHDVDQLLFERLVRRDALNGIPGVELVFDAPTRDWVARRNAPAVDLYLYDIREDLQRRVPTWEDKRGPDGQVSGRRQPARRFRLAYLVDRLDAAARGRAPPALVAPAVHAQEPDAQARQPRGIARRDGPSRLSSRSASPRPRSASLADIWSALGGELKPSLDLVVIAPVLPDSDSYYGPPVTAGPTIGLSSTGGAEEAMGGSRRGKQR